MTEPVLVQERRDNIVVLRLNRPEARNALNGELIVGIGAAMLAAEQDPDVRAIVLTGTGDRAFCAGMDLRSFSEGNTVAPFDDSGFAGFQRFIRGEIAVPVVGAANATAVAGGLELLLGCDLIVLAEGAQLGLPEVKRGLVAAGGGTFLGLRIPLSVALELTLTGDTIDAARAFQLGLANAVVPAAEVLAVALDLAGRIARNGPLAVRATKELVRLAITTDSQTAWARVGEVQPVIFASEDAMEGATAFVEKRPAVWKGR